jgi:hypothetical protein
MRHDSVKAYDIGQFINEFWTLSIAWNVCNTQMMMTTQMMVNSLSMRIEEVGQKIFLL